MGSILARFRFGFVSDSLLSASYIIELIEFRTTVLSHIQRIEIHATIKLQKQ